LFFGLTLLFNGNRVGLLSKCYIYKNNFLEKGLTNYVNSYFYFLMRYYLLIILLLPLACLGQVKISGRVLNTSDKWPVANASVFLSNATVGSKTNDDGSFTLYNVKPGQYELVVSFVGYETTRQNVLVNKADISLPAILLASKIIQLKEIRVQGNDEDGVLFAKNYEVFKKEFLGSSDFAKQCKILNPDILDLDYDAKARKLTGTSSDFLEIENKALGYKIRYLLSEFSKEDKTMIVYFEGSALFEDMQGSPSQIKKWQKRRKEVFAGSTMHFLKATIARQVAAEGFTVFRLIRKPNPQYTAGLDTKYLQRLVRVPLQETDYTSLTDKKGLYALKFNDCLYVMYSKKKQQQQEFSGFNKVIYNSNYLSTVLTFAQPYSLFDINGIITNPSSVIFEGNWGVGRIAELLPVDYTPEEK